MAVTRKKNPRRAGIGRRKTYSRSSGRRAKKSASGIIKPLTEKKIKPIIAKLTKPRAHPHAFGNPLAVKWPSSALSPEKANRIVILSRIQHRLWTWTVALAILLLLLVAAIELAPMIGWGLQPSASRAQLLEQADLTALVVLVLELAAQYHSARNKALFLRQNWLLILALLPFGVFMRAASLLESARAIRAVQTWGKLDELRVVVPSLEVPLVSPLVVWGENGASMISQWAGWGEFTELLGRISGIFSR